MAVTKKKLLIIYHSQGGTMERLAQRFALGAGHEEDVETIFKPAAESGLEDLLQCHGIAIGSPEYFGTMAGMIKDFFDRTYEGAREKTIGLPFVLFVCAGNDGRGAIAQIERIVSGYKWRQTLENQRFVGEPSDEDLNRIEELGHTMAAGVGMGIF
ncbi:MAG: flavodoxin family protein [Desulfobulbus sp.]